MRTVRHPLYRQTIRQYEPDRLYGLKNTRTEDLGQRKSIEQVFSAELFPLSALPVQAPTRYDQVNMRMIVQRSRVRMLHGRHPHSGTQFFIIGAKILQGTHGTRKQDAIDLSLMLPCQGAQFIG